MIEHKAEGPYHAQGILGDILIYNSHYQTAPLYRPIFEIVPNVFELKFLPFQNYQSRDIFQMPRNGVNFGYSL